MQMVEITKQAFNVLKGVDVKCLDVIGHETYTDVFWITIHGVIVVERKNFLCADQYFIRDINA